MRLMIKENVNGWTMTGLIGKDAKWFLGFSSIPKVLVSCGGKTGVPTKEFLDTVESIEKILGKW